MVKCLIAFGSNVGDCRANIDSAMHRISDLPDTNLLAQSKLIQTAPVGVADQVFLNGAVLLETERPASQLMVDLLAIEALGGRDRKKNPGNRPIDLDILLYGDTIIEEERLVVPHPRMTFRRFVLEPSVEIAGNMRHPVADCSLARLLQRLRRQRNIIVVHHDHSDLQQQIRNEWQTRKSTSLDQKNNSPSSWCFSSQPREALASMRKSIFKPRSWWIWVKCNSSESDNPQSVKWLNRFSQAAKLNIYLSSKPGSDMTIGAQRTAESGFMKATPYWYLPANAGELFSHVDTAIQSMLPLNGTKT